MAISTFFKRYWPSLLVVAVILYATLSPDPAPGMPSLFFPGIDKLIHAVMMGGLTGAIAFDYMRAKPIEERSKCLSAKVLLTIFIIVCAFSLLTEIGQRLLTATRQFEGADIVADIAGSAIGIALSRPVLRMALKQS